MFSLSYFHIPDFIIYAIMVCHAALGFSVFKEDKQSGDNSAWNTWEYPVMPLILAGLWVVSFIASGVAGSNPLTADIGGTAIFERRGEMVAIILFFMYAVGVTPFGRFLPLDEKKKTLPHGYEWTLGFIVVFVVLSYWINFIHLGRIKKIQDAAVADALEKVAADAAKAPGAAFGKTRTFGKKKI